MAETKILAFAGSLREASLNKKLARAASKGAERAGASVTYIDLKEYKIPIYDGDIEDATGIPEKAVELKSLFKAHDGFLISCPEYNGSITGVLKNVIDWVSRPMDGEKTLECFKGKTAGLLAAAPGNLGGIRGLREVRTILSGIGVIVLPKQFALSSAAEVLSDDGTITDESRRESAEGVAAELARVTAKLRSA